MKQALSLNELAAAVQHNSAWKKDFIMPASGFNMIIPNEKLQPMYEINGRGAGVTEHAFNQIGNDLGIPAGYRRKLIESNNQLLLEENYNTLLKQSDRNRMFRTINGTLRGYLSDSFSVDYDNDVILKAVLPVLNGMGNKIKVESCALTETKMYLKVTSTDLMADVAVGDPVNGGIAIMNSEVGMSFYTENSFINRLICKNGMVMPHNISSFRKMHRGSKRDIGTIMADTQAATSYAIALQIRDSIINALSPVRFQKVVEDMKATKERKISGKPEEAIKELGKTVGFTQSEGDKIFRHLIEGGDLSQYGMLNAVTRYAQDDDIDYDRATQLESMGGKILELTPKQWKRVEEAA